MSTIFTKIINKEIDADIVYEDESSIAFNDKNAQAPYHILIIPKKEIATINDISTKDKESLKTFALWIMCSFEIYLGI